MCVPVQVTGCVEVDEKVSVVSREVYGEGMGVCASTAALSATVLPMTPTCEGTH